MLIFCGGCATTRYSVIPQEKLGPHGGALVLIDKGIPDYVEFVAIPGEKEWTFQVFGFDRNMEQQSIIGSGYLTVELPDGAREGGNLWNTNRYPWREGKGHLENKISLKNATKFVAKVSIRHNKHTHSLTFNYPYN